MRVLLVNPEFPNSYWSGKYSLAFSRRKSLLPPLGLITIAAMLPRDWECRLVDLNQDPLSDADLQNADLVMLTGMLVQRQFVDFACQRHPKLLPQLFLQGGAIPLLIEHGQVLVVVRLASRRDGYAP